MSTENYGPHFSAVDAERLAKALIDVALHTQTIAQHSDQLALLHQDLRAGNAATMALDKQVGLIHKEVQRISTITDRVIWIAVAAVLVQIVNTSLTLGPWANQIIKTTAQHSAASVTVPAQAATIETGAK